MYRQITDTPVFNRISHQEQLPALELMFLDKILFNKPENPSHLKHIVSF